MRTRRPNLTLLSLTAVLAVGLPMPAHAQIVVESTIQEHHARVGESYTGTVRVRNSSAETQEAKVYLTDYQFFADGRTLFPPSGSTERSNARWISAPARVVVPPGGEATVRYTVAVPGDSARPRTGTYWSTLMIEGITSESAESSRRSIKRARAEVGVRAATRYAVQVVTHLPGGERKAELSGSRVARAPGGHQLELDILNTGSMAYRLAFTLELYDAQGSLAGKLEQQRGLLFPGTSVRQRFTLPTLPSGDYKALLIADTGTEDVFGAQYRLKL